MAKGDWWFKFEWDSWLCDEKLALCTFETQGFWIRCLALMNRADSYELTGTVDQLRRLLGCLPEEVTRCARDLKETGAADVSFGNGSVIITSRRRKRELQDKERNRLQVAKHREKVKSNPDVRRQSKSKSLKQEKKEEESSYELLSSEADDVSAVFGHWQKVCGKEKFSLTPTRKKIIQTRLKDGFTADQLKTAITRAQADPFYRGINDRQKDFLDFKTIFRNKDKIEEFLYSEEPAKRHNPEPSDNDLFAYDHTPARVPFDLSVEIAEGRGVSYAAAKADFLTKQPAYAHEVEAYERSHRHREGFDQTRPNGHNPPPPTSRSNDLRTPEPEVPVPR